jgi:hypothetical protein
LNFCDLTCMQPHTARCMCVSGYSTIKNVRISIKRCVTPGGGGGWLYREKEKVGNLSAWGEQSNLKRGFHGLSQETGRILEMCQGNEYPGAHLNILDAQSVVFLETFPTSPDEAAARSQSDEQTASSSAARDLKMMTCGGARLQRGEILTGAVLS